MANGDVPVTHNLDASQVHVLLYWNNSGTWQYVADFHTGGGWYYAETNRNQILMGFSGYTARTDRIVITKVM